MLTPLTANDCIGFFSPSAPATVTAPKRFGRAKAYLEAKGFRMHPGKLTSKSDGYRSGTILQRAEELNDLIRNPDVAGIMSTIGGQNSNALVPYIDYDAFRKHPKIIVGHSDVTVILLAILARTGITTFYGPALIPSFGEFPPFVDVTFSHFADITMAPISVPHTYLPPEYWTDDFANWEEKTCEKTRHENQWITVNPGVAVGRVIGGTLNAMVGIWSTPYMPKIGKGDILFIEDTAKTASYMEKLFSLLKASGILATISGLILGKHERFDDQGTGKTPYDILMEVWGNPRVPVLAQFDCGHTHPMFTLPLGGHIELDATRQQVTIIDNWMK